STSACGANLRQHKSVPEATGMLDHRRPRAARGDVSMPGRSLPSGKGLAHGSQATEGLLRKPLRFLDDVLVRTGVGDAGIEGVGFFEVEQHVAEGFRYRRRQRRILGPSRGLGVARLERT